MGAINEAEMNFLGDLGRRITKHTDDHRESAFLFQRISTLTQRFNAVTVLGTLNPHNPRGRRLAVPVFLDLSLVFNHRDLYYRGYPV